MRLGEVLVSRGLVTREQLHEGLRAQVMWGGRLGTALVELQYVSLDDLSRAIGVQHGLPAALATHFEKADRELQQKLAPALAESLQCLPLVRAGKRVVIAAAAPLDDAAQTLVAGALGIERSLLVQSVAAELRIRYQLELVYGLPRPARYMRSHGATDQSALFRLPDLRSNGIGGLPIGDVDHRLPSPRRTSSGGIPFDGMNERRAYVRTLADLLAGNTTAGTGHERTQRIDSAAALRPIAVGTTPIVKVDAGAVAGTLAEALVEIELSRDRDELVGRAIATVERFVADARSGMLLLVRGAVAVSSTSFNRDRTELPDVAVPLDHPGLVAAAMKRKAISRGSSGDLSPIDYLLLTSLGLPYGDLVVSPLMIAGHVIGMIVFATRTGGRLDDVPAISSAASAAFARLMSEAGGESPLRARQKPVRSARPVLPRTTTPR